MDRIHYHWAALTDAFFDNWDGTTKDGDRPPGKRGLAILFRIAILVGFVSVLLGVMLLGYYQGFVKAEELRKVPNLKSGGEGEFYVETEELSRSDGNINYFTALLHVIDLNLAHSRYTLLVVVTDSTGGYSDGYNKVTKAFKVLLPGMPGPTARAVNVGDYLPYVVKGEVPFDSGKQTLYPFDEFEGSLAIAVVDAETGKPIDLLAFLSAAATGFHFGVLSNSSNFLDASPDLVLKAPTANMHDVPGAAFTFTIKRSPYVKGFSMFIVILMWFVSLFFLAVAAQVVMRKRETTPLFAASAALMFGLLALRNAQPSIPPIGVAADALGFYYNMFFVVLAFLTLVACHLGRFEPPPRQRALRTLEAAAVDEGVGERSGLGPYQAGLDVGSLTGRYEHLVK